MIVVQVHLLSAITGKATKLGEMRISNDGVSIDPKKGNYNGEIMRKPDFSAVTRTGRIENHPRLSQTIWHLVGKMLANMGYAR